MTAFPPGSTEAALREAKRARRLIALSRVTLWWERAWMASWRGLAVLGLGLILALFEVWTELPAGPRILALSALLLVAATLFWRDWEKVFWPSREAGIRRLEDANALPHRPVSAAEDRLAFGGGDPVTDELWRRHIARQLAVYGALEPAWPRPNVSIRDPYAVRALVVLGLAAGFLAAGGDAPRRLAAAFAVDSGGSQLPLGVALDAWISPPEYTGEAPIIMAQSSGAVALDISRAVGVPAGSKLTVRLDGGTAPEIERTMIDTAGAEPVRDAPAKAGDAFTAEYPLDQSQRIRITASGRVVGDWEITVLPDAPPAISFDGDIQATPKLTTRIAFKAGDDHGVQKAEMHIRLAPDSRNGNDPTIAKGEDEIVLPLPAGGKDPRKLQTAVFEDLTANPWAGLDVDIELTATDAVGQTGASGSKRFTLPEREFHNPLAKAIVEQRKNLSRGPGAIPDVLTALDAFALAPDQFETKPGVYLTLRSAYWRLMDATGHKEVAGVQALLWDLALAIEDGGVTLAADKVRQLQKDLQAALDKNAPDEEVQRLTEELRQAMREYMGALAKNAPNMQLSEDLPTISQDDFEKMLDKIEDMSKLGAKDAAKELLSQMQDMMEGMSGPMAEPSEKEQQLAQTLQELNDIVKEQEKLRDETFREEQQGRDAGEEAHDQRAKELAEAQKKLEERLGKLAEQQQGQGDKGDPQSKDKQPGQQPDGQQGKEEGAGKQPGDQPGEGQPGEGQPGGDQPGGDQGGEQKGAQGGDQKGGDQPGAREGNAMAEAGQAMGDAQGALKQGDTEGAVPSQDEALAKLKSARDAARKALAQEQKKGGGVRVGRSMGGRKPGMDPAGRPEANGPIDNGSVKVPTERETQRARDILNELRKRSGETQRPEEELNYLERLLRRF